SPDFGKRDLGNVDGTAAKAAFTIHQVVAPQVVESVGEPIEDAARYGLVIARAPALQCLCIIEAERFTILPPETAVCRERFELRLVDEHSAGKNISLDKVGVVRIAIENAVIEADELQGGAAAQPQVSCDTVQIGAPPAPTDRLHHLHR